VTRWIRCEGESGAGKPVSDVCATKKEGGRGGRVSVDAGGGSGSDGGVRADGFHRKRRQQSARTRASDDRMRGAPPGLTLSASHGLRCDAAPTGGIRSTRIIVLSTVHHGGTDDFETNTHLYLTVRLSFLPIVECRQEEANVGVDELGRGASTGIRRARSKERERADSDRQATGQ
jgi:hypothetical protein